MKSTHRLIVLLCFIILGSISAQAQFRVYGKVVTEEKKKYHGEVIKYEPLDYVIMDCQGDTLNFDLNRCEFKFTDRKPPKPYNFPDGVGYHRLSIGVMTADNQEGNFLEYSYQFQKNRLFGYGGNISVDSYGSQQGYNLLSLRGMATSYFTAKNASPFARAELGYGYTSANPDKFQTKARGGLNGGLFLGYRFSTNTVMVDLIGGVRFQQAKYTFDFGDTIRNENNRFNRVVFGLGFMW